MAHAQATRTWVSGVGDDANPCSRTAPCKTFAGAISKTAAGGEISVLDPGGFGALTITKAITLNGEGTLGSILATIGNGINVNAGPTDVVYIRNLSINGGGGGTHGVRFFSGAELHVEKVSIFGFTGEAIRFDPASGANRLFVSDSSFRHNNGGMYIVPTTPATASASLSRVEMQGNDRGLRADDGSWVVVHDSVISGNHGNGVIAYGVGRWVEMSLDNTVISGNAAAGIRSQLYANVRISNVTITTNDTGLLSVSGGGIISSKNNRVQGNVTTDGLPTASPGEI